ncbi:MAG: sigma-54-dependent Fis family transcriptional regulator [Deltaproteobacteria bacterium]|nr:sigma-54-dependent Fis family transcriptional regulator [Deltaproteobacteria bacterium]
MVRTGATILVVDDEQGILDSLARIFGKEGYGVLTAPDGQTAMGLMREHRVNVVVADLMMPHMGGQDLLRAVKAVSPEVEVIVMTAYGTVENAVAAMKDGAYDFVTKPLKRAYILRTVAKALEKQNLVAENRALRAELQAARGFGAIVGTSPALRRTLDVIAQAAPSEATVLILGESGTGKELMARALHLASARLSKPFVIVNCAALPESIIEAELFGYEKGAFTGAVSSREGRFAMADSGTVFLDEIGELAPQVQVKLLRVLQEGEVERLGGGTVNVDVRIVAATNKDLAQEVKEGRFREDLYYRLNVIAVEVPPLRCRREDVALLAEHFLVRYRDKNHKQVRAITDEAMNLMIEYDWPGNVRELENALERAVVLTRSDVIEAADLPPEIRRTPAHSDSGRILTFSIGTPLEEMERRVILETLRHTKGDKRLAAQLLGIATRTIYRKLEAFRAEDSSDRGTERKFGEASGTEDSSV